MPFSRNPKTGEIESYTENGFYLGHVCTMGDLVSQEFANDGGPGSGNHGHAGRPGKKGGSAPNGGSSGGGSAEHADSSGIKSMISESRTGFEIGLKRAKSNDGEQYRFFADYIHGAMYGEGESHDAAYAYSYHGDVMMNNLLRGGKPHNFGQQKEWKKDVEKTKGQIEALTKACDRNSLRQPAVVFRGIATDVGFAKMLGIEIEDTGGFDSSKKIRELTSDPEFAESLIGQTFSDPAFTSTSIDPEAPRKSGFIGPCEMEILLPKGTKGLYFGDQVAITDEHEFLLQRGTQFVITGAEVVTNLGGGRDKHLKLQVMVVDQVPKEIPYKYVDAFPEARPEVEKAVQKGTVFSQEKLEKLYPEADPDVLEEIASIKQKKQNGEMLAADTHRLWELLHLQCELGYVTPLEASELEAYAMENADRIDPSSYEREIRERDKKIKEFEENKDDESVINLRASVQGHYPELRDEDTILHLMAHQAEIDRLEERIKTDVKQYGEGPIVKGMRRALEEEKRSMEYISRNYVLKR